MKTRTLAIVGAAALAWMLVVRAPAELLYAWLAPKAAAVRAIGLEGSLTEGRAGAVTLNGHPLLTGLHWRFEPWWLPLLRCEFQVDAAGGSLNLAGHAAYSASGVSLRHAQASGPIKALLNAAGLPLAPLDGLARIDLKSLALSHGFPAAAEGTVEAHGLVWMLAKDPLPLGDFKATIVSGSDGIAGHIEPLAGPVDLSGEVHLQGDQSYDYDLKLKARPGADPNLLALLQSLGQQDTQGYWHLRNRGTLGGTLAGGVPPPFAGAGR
ncbi:MAG: type II secretion system protein N [Nevskia sp.]|nr:type II secretion system protein N [Nevskia sp.]